MAFNGKVSKLPAVILCGLLAVLIAVPIFAQGLNRGKIEGTVRDQDTGQPLAGVQVVVEGTNLGNVTNADGYYFILNVPPGQQDVTFAYTGYQKVTVQNQEILAGQTTTIDVQLSSTVVELEGITIEGETEVLMPRDNTVSKQRLTGDKLTESPVTKLEDLMVLEAGVQIGGEGGRSRGLRIRGARLGDEMMVVDGVAVRNYTADPFRPGRFWVWQHETSSLGEDTNPLEFSTSSVEEVDIITGGFQAEYGNAQGGIINIVTKEGGPKYRGNVRWTTDAVNPRTSDYGFNQLQTSTSGPVPGIPHLFFHASGELKGQEDTYPTHADEGFRGVNQKFVDRLNQAVRNDPVLGDPEWWLNQGFEEARPVFTLEEMAHARQAYVERIGDAFFDKHFWVQKGLFTPEHPARIPWNFSDLHTVTGKLTYHPLRELKFISTYNFSRNQRVWPSDSEPYFDLGWVTPQMMGNRAWDPAKGDMFMQREGGGVDTVAFIPVPLGRRTRTSNFLSGVDWDFYRSANRSASVHFRYSNFVTQDINSSTLMDNYQRETELLSFDVNDMRFLVDFFPGKDHPTGADAAYYFPDGTGVWSRDLDYWRPFGYVQDSQLYYLNYRYLREKQHNYKLDLDFQLDRWNRMKAGAQGIFFDNRMFQVRQTPRELDNEFNHNPRIYAFYVQNRTDLGDFVFDYGLRYDAFQPRDNWAFRFGDQYGERYYPKNKSSWSPRFNVAFPVTDKTQLRFSFGRFTQLPSFANIFSGSNPGNLGYSRTDAFEAGLSYLLSDDMVLDLVAFHRDGEGLIAQGNFFRDYWMEVTDRHFRGWQNGYQNSDRSNIKGMDLTLKKRFSQNYSVNAMYTLQFSRMMGSSYLQSTHDELRPARGDRTHKISGHFNYMTPDDILVSNDWANRALKDVRVYLIGRVMSGAPQGYYVPYGGSSLGTERGRWDYNFDMRVTKTFRLGAGRSLSFYTQIYNLTGKKDHNQYPSGYRYQSYYRSDTGGQELKWEDEQNYPSKYLFPTDWNGDGVLSLMENAKGQIADSFVTANQDWENWGLARQIRSGVEFRW